MSQYYIYIQLPLYLSDWLINEYGENDKIRFPKGSPEHILLETLLSKQPVGAIPSLNTEKTTILELPYYKNKDVRIYNFLSANAINALTHQISNRFKIQLWEELHTLDNTFIRITDLIYIYMERHGISDEPENFETIRQIYYRMRKKCEKKRPYLNT